MWVTNNCPNLSFYSSPIIRTHRRFSHLKPALPSFFSITDQLTGGSSLMRVSVRLVFWFLYLPAILHTQLFKSLAALDRVGSGISHAIAPVKPFDSSIGLGIPSSVQRVLGLTGSNLLGINHLDGWRNLHRRRHGNDIEPRYGSMSELLGIE